MAHMLPITATFIDEISHDIPHQNWGEAEWDRDFAHMVNMGIDTVVLIRSGYRKFLTYPSQTVISDCQGFTPVVDLVALFLKLSDKYGLDFYFGTYDSGRYWDTGDMGYEVEVNLKVIEEAYQRYGHHKSFKGWYLSLELSRNTKGAVPALSKIGEHCKLLAPGLPVLISPWIDGVKAVQASSDELRKENAVNLEQHEKEWNGIFKGIQGYIDIVAFQDGHVTLSELPDYLAVNKGLADAYGLQSWTNCESFDRDMPIKFMPIKFEKLWHKLKAAREAGIEKALTFEFSHFMSPQSAYLQAGHLYNRYRDQLQKELGK